MKKYLFFLLLACVMESCWHDAIEEGRYHVSSVSVGPEGKMKTLLSDLPVFDFKRDQMKVSSDFYFGFFEDSVYRYSYQYENCILKLRGKHQQIDLQCKPECGGYEISLDSDILKSFIILPNER